MCEIVGHQWAFEIPIYWGQWAREARNRGEVATVLEYGPDNGEDFEHISSHFVMTDQYREWIPLTYSWEVIDGDLALSTLSTGTSSLSFPTCFHSLSSCNAHSFLTHPPLSNVLGQSTEKYIRPFHHMPSLGNCPTWLRLQAGSTHLEGCAHWCGLIPLILLASFPEPHSSQYASKPVKVPPKFN